MLSVIPKVSTYISIYMYKLLQNHMHTINVKVVSTKNFQHEICYTKVS